MFELVSMLEIQTSPTPLYLATVEGVVDENGKVYHQKLLGHPAVSWKLSNVYFGTLEITDLTAILVNLDRALSAVFRGTHRGVTVVLRRRRLDTGDLVLRTTAKLQSAAFISAGSIQLNAADVATELLATEYPMHRLSPAMVGSLTADLSVDRAVPVVVGAVREHTPTCYAESNFLLDYYRYIACLGLWPLYLASEGDHPPLVRPYINTVYRGFTGGALVVNPGEYDIEWRDTEPLIVQAGFTATPTATAPQGGAVSGSPTYIIEAHNAYGLLATSAAFGPGSVSSKTVRLTWEAVHAASFYRIKGRTGVGSNILATVGGHDTVTWDDDGSLSPNAGDLTDIDPQFRVPNWDYTTGLPSRPNFISIIFRTPQFFSGSQLAPILADVEVTELGPTTYTSGLWLFRNDMRNFAAATYQPNNILVTSRTMHYWSLKGAFAADAFCADAVGSANLVNGGIRASEVVANGWSGLQTIHFPNDGAVLDPPGLFYASWGRNLYLLRANSTDMDFDSTTSFRVKAMIRPGNGTGSQRMGVCGKGDNLNGFPGWFLSVEEGAATFKLRDAGTYRYDPIVAKGSTMLDGGWHLIEGELDRVNGFARVYVDGVLEDEVDCVSLGSLVTNADNTVLGQVWGTFRIGATGTNDENFEGDVEHVEVLSGYGSPLTFVNGKADSGTNALDLSMMWEPPWIPEATALDLDPGTDSFLIQAWVRPLSVQGGDGGVVVSKVNSAGTNGWDIALEDVGGLAKATAHVHIGGTEYALESVNEFLVDRWNLVALHGNRNTGTARLYLNGKTSPPVTIPGSVIAGGDFVIGALDRNGACQFNGYIDEVHVETGIGTDFTSPAGRGFGTHRHCFYMGMRNAVRQLRTLLQSHEFNVSLDVAVEADLLGDVLSTWDTAEDDLGAVTDLDGNLNAIRTDLAMVEPAPFKAHAAELLRVRGIRLGLTAAGLWTCRVDQSDGVAEKLFGFDGDGIGTNIIGRPVWTETALKEMVKRAQIRYRRRRVGDGSTVQNFVRRTPPRDVMDDGPHTPVLIDLPSQREETSADIVADYTCKQLALADRKCSFVTGGDGFALSGVGALIRILDPGSDITDETRRVVGLVDRGLTFELATIGWDAALYTYAIAKPDIDAQLEVQPDDIDVLPEDTPDYTYTPPPRVTDVAAVVGDDRLVTVSWTIPDSPNYASAVVSWRRKPEAGKVGMLYVVAGETTENSLVVAGIPAHNDAIASDTFQIRVQSKNRVGLLGALVTTEVDVP